MKKLLLIICFLLLASPVLAEEGAVVTPKGIGAAFNNEDLKKVAETGAGYKSVGTDNSLEARISQIISLVLSFLGVIFLVLFIYAGYLWMMAQGNEKDVQKAKDIMQRAIVGIIIVVAAYGISYYVIKNVSDGQLNNVTDTTVQPDP